MTRPPRLVLDTNVVVSAFLWQGRPGEFFALAGEGEIRLFTSAILLDELRTTLAKPRLAKATAATGLLVAEMAANYRRLATLVRASPLAAGISRDPDDDHVIACAIAARANWIVTGDDDLLALREAAGFPIRTVAEVLAELA